jgi:HEAT repeat protein
MEKLRIFISGTQDDLRPERKAVAGAIRALGHELVMAETYGTQPMPSISTIREMVDRADIYIGVYGALYGYKPDDKVSVTEFEFTEFRRKHPDRILTYIKEIHPEPQQEAFLDRVQDFKEGYFRRPKFKDANQLADWVKEDLAQFIARVVHEKLRGTPDAALIKAYLAQVAANKPYVLWSDETYIDRTVTAQHDETLYPRFAARYDPRAPERDAKPEPLEAALAREKKLILLGEPGIGKTTSLLHLAWQAAQPCEGSQPSQGFPREIPIYIELKYYNGEPELETLLARRVDNLLRAANMTLDRDSTKHADILRKWLAQSDANFLLLVDGLNEVRPEFHTAIRGALNALLHTPQRIVISCRERDYDASLRDNAAAFVLQGLQADEISDYLRRVLGNKSRFLFGSQIRVDEKMLTLAANPLMLWLVGVVAQNEARLPKNRGKLFQRFVVMMPQIRRRDVPANVPLDVVNTALAKLGFEMQERGRLSADLGEVRGWQIPTAGRSLEDVLAQAKDWRLLKSDGQLGEPVEFLHQLFIEYFAAVYLKAEIGDSRFEILGERSFSGKWDEVIVMLAGISDRPVELLRWLAARVVDIQHALGAFLVHRCFEASDATQEAGALAAVLDAFSVVLHDPNESVRVDAAIILLNIQHPRAIELIIAILPTVGRQDMLALNSALGYIRAPYVVEPSIIALSNPEVNVRTIAIGLLAQSGDKRAVEPLITTLRDASAWVRSRAALALGKIGDARAVKPLIAALGDADEEVRRHAAESLGEIGDMHAVESLVAALHDTDIRVVLGVASALARVGDMRGMEVIIATLRDGNSDLRIDAVTALEKIGAVAVQPLISALHDTDAVVRVFAADALGKIGDVRGVEPLISALRDSYAGLRCRAAIALGKIGDARALPDLERMALEDKGESIYGLVATWARWAAEKIRQRMEERQRTQTD